MIYFGNFMQLTNQQAPSESERRYGEFSLVVEADDYDAAVDQFKQRIKEYRETSSLFEGECTIFFTQLLEFVDFPRQAAMLNYKSFAGDPMMPFIGCSLPDSDDDSCKIYNWEENNLEVGGHRGKLFLEFRD
jgi:hypothetical protein